MGKQVRVLTKCGEEYVYNYDQEVDTVKIVEPKYRNQDVLKQLQDIYDAGCGVGACNECALKIPPHMCVLCDMLDAVQEAQGYKK